VESVSDPDSQSSASARAVLGLCEFLALMFGLPPGEALYHRETIDFRMACFIVVGGFFAALGPAWPAMRKKFPQQVLILSLGRAASDARVWIAVLLLIFAYVTVPEMYRRTTTPVESPACWDGKAPPCNDQPAKPAPNVFVSPIPPGPIGPFTPSWEDAVNFEQAFFSLPRPCLVKIVPNTEEDLHARNVLSAILRMNKACDVTDEQTDQVPKRVDIDAPMPQKFSGLIIRWHSDFKEGDKLFSALRGFYNVREGHVMPDNSQGNLILIVIGSGRWHRYPPLPQPDGALVLASRARRVSNLIAFQAFRRR